MPFDALPQTPTLSDLSALLRDRSRWPDTFEWDYAKYDCCAVGLVETVWDYRANQQFHRQLGGRDWRRIFVYMHPDTTPEQVADEIDHAYTVLTHLLELVSCR